MRLIELFLEICKHLLGFTNSFFMLLYRMYNFENPQSQPASAKL